MKFTYGGDVAATYPTYLDVGGDRPVTLVAEPGRTYEIRPAEGHTVPGEDGEPVALELPMPPDDRWTKAAAEDRKKKEG